MRLYDASSCTPCCSNWENPARQRQTALSFVPTTSAFADSMPQAGSQLVSTENEEGGDNDNDKKQRRKLEQGAKDDKPRLPVRKKLFQCYDRCKYQNLSTAPSNSTSTTGSETPPPHNNTPSAPSPVGESDKKERKLTLFGGRKSALQTLGCPLLSEQDVQHSIPRTKVGPPRRASTQALKSETSTTKQQEVLESGVDVSIDVDADSYSTLTTTRSMMSQQNQKDVQISVASISLSSSKITSHPGNEVKPSSHRSIMHRGPPPAAQEVPTSMTGNISCARGSESPLKKATTNQNTSRWQLAGKGTQTSNVSSTKTASAAPENNGARPTCSGQSQLPSLVRSQSSEVGEDYAVVKERQRKAKQKVDRIDFFPVHRPQKGFKAAPMNRLGASSFPSFRQHQDEISSDDNWDPFHNDTSNTDAEDGSWVAFGNLQSSKDWNSSHKGESPISFPTWDVESLAAKENSIVAFLQCDEANGSYDYPDNKENHRNTAGPYQAAKQDPRNRGNIRKIVAQQGGGRSRNGRPRPDFLRKPKLLGPLLEKRFTRSYWLRLRGRSGLPPNDSS